MTNYASSLADDIVAIFLFHGVVPEYRHRVRNYTRKHLAAAEFAAIIDSLAGSGEPVSMNDIVSATMGRSVLPRRAFAVTFDDGFANNFCVARPLLAERRVPATFYVTTGFIDGNASSWTDRLEYAFEVCPTIRLSLPALQLDASCASTATAKRALLDEIRSRVKASAGVDPYRVADETWSQLGVHQMSRDPDLDDKMTWAQIGALANDPLFEVGGHGHTHRILEFLDDAALQEEIDTSVSMLRRGIGRAVTHYSYPEGLSHCYSDRVIRILQQHRIVCAPTAEHGVNRVGDDLFRLRRIMVN